MMQSETQRQKSKTKIDKSKKSFLKIFFLLSSFFLLPSFFAGCSLKSIALKSTADLLDQGLESFYEEKDILFAEQSLASHLKLLEVLLKNDPLNEKLNLYAAQGFGAYAFLFLEEKDAERAKIFYERGRDYGLKLIRKKYKIDFLNESDIRKIDKVLEKLSKKDVPILFWSAYCWGGFLNLNRDNPQSLADLPKVHEMMMRVHEIAPDYFYGGAPLFLGSYYGSRPKIFGGNLEKSRSYFDQAGKISKERFLIALVLCAKYYAVPAQNKELYETLLEKVNQFSLADFPEQRLVNEIAKERAKKMLEEIDEKF